MNGHDHTAGYAPQDNKITHFGGWKDPLGRRHGLEALLEYMEVSQGNRLVVGLYGDNNDKFAEDVIT